MSKFKKPENVEKRLKMFVYGPAGVGKTVATLQFPNAAIIDTERGTDFYTDMINKANSSVLQTNDCDEIYNELNQLLTTQHQYRTVIIDPITQVYNGIQEKWARIFEKYAKNEKDAEVQDFGMRFWGKVKSEFKSLQRLLIRLDTNVIITAHQKDVYGTGMTKMGVTFDSMKGDDYFFDLVFRIINRDGQRIAIREKERAEPGKERFPKEFEWSYENFLKFYGKDIIEKESKPVAMATPEQVTKIRELVSVVKISDEEIIKWYSKAEVDDWSEMTGEQIGKCIDFVEKKLSVITDKKESK